MPVKHINAHEEFLAEINQPSKLVVADFFATWCGPCVRIAPFFESLSNKYPAVSFIKIDVDKCQETAAGQGVSAMPTFNFYINHNKVDQLRGADQNGLEAKVKQWSATVGGGTGENGDQDGGNVPLGQIDISSFVMSNDLECLNENDHKTLKDLLGGGALESDCDEQLIMNMGFNQPVKIHSITMKAPATNGPKTVKLFINCPTTPDFDKAEATAPVQQIEFTPEQLTNGTVIPLKFVKFQNVQSLQIFVKDNQDGSEVTRIEGFKMYGSTINATKMDDFKRVAGKKGEVDH